MSKLIIKLTTSQLEDNDILSLVAARLYGYFIENSFEDRDKIINLFDDLCTGIEELKPKEERSLSRLGELNELYQTFKIKEYFADIINKLGLDSVIVECPKIREALQNRVQEYLLGIFTIEVSGN